MPLIFVRNDITKMKVDAIVNTANTSLLGGSGVDGAIHEAAGPELLEECRTLNGCPIGGAKITKGYALPCKYVIHTVGPEWRGGARGEREMLESSYRSSLDLARQYQCRSVAFPLISTGTYRYPKDQAVEVATTTIRGFLNEHEDEMDVYIVVFDRESLALSKKTQSDIEAFISDEYVDKRLERDRYRWRYGRRRNDLQEAPDEAFSSELSDVAVFQSLPAAGFSEEKRPSGDLSKMIAELDLSFSQMLMKLIEKKGMKASDCYKRANISRKVFSKIRSKEDYRPKRETAIAFSVALKLNYEETQAFLRTAGYALSYSSIGDRIVEYFIRKKIYDIDRINIELFDYDQRLLGY